MDQKTFYKRDEEGKKVAKELKTKIAKIRFKNRSIHINKIITIGRDELNDIVIKDDPLVYRRHAIIEKVNNIYYLQDKGSTNGTYLNNNPVLAKGRIQLKSGDVIMIGKTKLNIL
ncbi:MAG: FHA domain-containing protein [Spirochaetota bacterium]|nr:FHA domain-containing protein [Spirochaetota bacterium]